MTTDDEDRAARKAQAEVEAVASAKALVDALLRDGSARRGRPMDWPRPAILKGVAGVDAAAAQDRAGFVADKHFRPVRVRLPLNWALNPFADKAWIMRLMCLQPADPFFYAHDETGDPAMLDRAAGFVLDWARFHLVEGRRAFQSWADMACGYRAIKIARLIDALADGRLELAPDAATLLARLALAHVRELTDPATLSHGNHGIFQMHGLAILATMLGAHPDAMAARRYAARTMAMLVRKQFDDEGMHLEHSPQYHYWMCDELKSLLGSGWHDVPEFDAIHERALRVRPWLTYPDGRLVPVGDTVTQFRHPTAIDPADATVATDAYLVRCFDAGYAICRSRPADGRRGSLMFLHGGYHSKAHKHSDHLHLEFFDDGRPVLVDSGSTGYRGGAHRAYCLSTRAHNTIEFDDIALERDGRHAYGSALRRLVAYERGVRVRAEIVHPEHGVRHVRTVEFEPGRRLRVKDELFAEVPRRFVQWFHLAPDLGIEPLDAAEAGGAAGGVHAITDADGPRWRIAQLDAVDETRIVRGQEEPMLQGWCAAGMDELVPSHALGYVRHGTQVMFRFELVRAGGAWPHPALRRDPLADLDVAPRRPRAA